MPVITAHDAAARHIRRADMVACKVAFIDCRMPGSENKENYSLVGAGVTQSHDQVVNLTEPHGFSLGVAAMPAGTVNNLHVHFTAEVFMIHRGTWTFRWGADGQDGEIVGGPGDVVSVPTWIFRGFTQHGRRGWLDLHRAGRGTIPGGSSGTPRSSRMRRSTACSSRRTTCWWTLPPAPSARRRTR